MPARPRGKRAQRRMASEDVSLASVRGGQCRVVVLNAGWRLRMFHLRTGAARACRACAQRRMASEDVSHTTGGGSRCGSVVLNAGWRLRMFHISSPTRMNALSCAQRRMASEDVSLSPE